VDSASEADVDRFVRAPKKKLEELLDIKFEEDVDIVVRIESQGERALVIPQNDFGPITSDSDRPLAAAKIKLCPKGCTLTRGLCPADHTFTDPCPCTISCTVTPDFPTIDQMRSSEVSPHDSVKKLSDLLDD
jgi:hypothetical protein